MRSERTRNQWAEMRVRMAPLFGIPLFRMTSEIQLIGFEGFFYLSGLLTIVGGDAVGSNKKKGVWVREGEEIADFA